MGQARRLRWPSTLVVALGVVPCVFGLAHAQAPEANDIEVHAFVSQGAIKSTGNNYLVDSKRGSVEFNEVGINFSKRLSDRLRVGLQLFSRDLGNTGNYKPQVDWFMFDYRVADWLGVRAGRTKVPFGLYNEVNDVDAARVSILLPQAIYPILNRDMLLAQTGLEFYGYIAMGAGGGLEYRLYGGTFYIDPPVVAPPTKLEKFSIPYLFGGRLLWETPVIGLRAGVSAQTLRMDADYSVQGPAGTPPARFELGLPFLLWLASVEYIWRDLLLAAEYGRWSADVESNLAPTKHVENERFYVMAAYHVNPWFNPGLYVSYLVPNVDDQKGRDSHQRDVAATLRFDLTSNLIFKLEGHFVHGTADLSSSLNGGAPLSSLQTDWLLFLAKATAYF